MHGSSHGGGGWSIVSVTPSHVRLSLVGMQQSFRVLLGLLAMSLTVCPGHGIRQRTSLIPPSGFSFAGYWQCSGNFPANGRHHRSIYHGEASADGKWLDLTETDIEPKGYVGRYQLGADAGKDKLVFIDTNSAGYAIFESPGWDGHTLIVTSTEVLHYSSASPKNRFLYTVHDPAHFDVEWQYEKSGAWTSGDLLHCAAQTPRLAVNSNPDPAPATLTLAQRLRLSLKPVL